MYRDILLALSRDTRFRISEPLPHPVSERRNPACGDDIAIHFHIRDRRMVAFRYHARACAVTLASAAALGAEVDGHSVQTVQSRLDQGLAYFASEEEWTRDWGADTLPALGEIRARPMRMACVRLPWEALRDALEP